MTIEQKIEQTILEQPIELTICGRQWQVPAVTVATLIMASSEISRLPQMDMTGENLVTDVLREARHCSALGRILAIFILGAKRINHGDEIADTTPAKRRWWQFKKHDNVQNQPCDVDKLATQIIEQMTPSQMHMVLLQIVQRMELADFFAITSFLTEASITKATKEVNQTASGQ